MRRLQKSQGFTLIELIVVISVTSTLATVNVGWIYQTFKFASQMRQRQSHYTNMNRLAVKFRDEVRSSDTIKLEDEDNLVLRFGDGSFVRYMISNSQESVELNVEKWQDDSVVARERFTLMQGTQLRLETTEMPDAISLIVARNSGIEDKDQSTEIVDLQVRVRPGRWSTDLSRNKERDLP